MAIEIETIAIGFFGGIIGGIVVNIVSYKFQKREEKQEEEKRYITEYKRSIKAILNEIIDTWNKELEKNPIGQTKIQNEFDEYSHRLTSVISRAPDDFPEDVIKEVKELSASLGVLKNPVHNGIGREKYENFKKECQDITEKSKHVREKIE